MDILIKAIKQALMKSIEEEADKIIEVKVNDFKYAMERQKNLAIGQIIDAVVVETTSDPISMIPQFTIRYNPIIKEGNSWERQ